MKMHWELESKKSPSSALQPNKTNNSACAQQGSCVPKHSHSTPFVLIVEQFNKLFWLDLKRESDTILHPLMTHIASSCRIAIGYGVRHPSSEVGNEVPEIGLERRNEKMIRSDCSSDMNALLCFVICLCPNLEGN